MDSTMRNIIIASITIPSTSLIYLWMCRIAFAQELRFWKRLGRLLPEMQADLRAKS